MEKGHPKSRGNGERRPGSEVKFGSSFVLLPCAQAFGPLPRQPNTCLPYCLTCPHPLGSRGLSLPWHPPAFCPGPCPKKCLGDPGPESGGRPPSQSPTPRRSARVAPSPGLQGRPPLALPLPSAFRLRSRLRLSGPSVPLPSPPPLIATLLSPPLQPPLSSPSPPLAFPSLAFPVLPSPPSSRLPHPWEAPPVGQRRLISGFPGRGRQRLVGGGSAGAGATSPGTWGPKAAHLRAEGSGAPGGSPLQTLPRPTRSPASIGGSQLAERAVAATGLPPTPSCPGAPSSRDPGPRLPARPGPGTMSEKSVETAPELSAKDLKEKKEKVEEKTNRKERKKDVVEEEENGAEEEEEETAEDGEDDDEGEEEDEEEEEDDDEGPALKRAAEDEDDADPKRQKTENGASV
ncbi:parathymosin [Notamacropus eugenii]|uniref:parathymosin n=1 Tax=Notamacropus eugenii TaxID=9315 RepID=UPI003B67DAA9